MSKHITIKNVVDGLTRIVKRVGRDHIAVNPSGGSSGNGCVYAVIVDGVLTPVCIVGQFFADLGYLGALVSSNDDGDIAVCYGGLGDGGHNFPGDGTATGALLDHGFTFEDGALRILRDAQAKQDVGETWFNAVSHAFESYHSRVVRDLPSSWWVGDLTKAVPEPLADWERDLLAGQDGDPWN